VNKFACYLVLIIRSNVLLLVMYSPYDPHMSVLALVGPQNKWHESLPAEHSHIYDWLACAQVLPHSTLPFTFPVLFLAPQVSLNEKTMLLNPLVFTMFNPL